MLVPNVFIPVSLVDGIKTSRNRRQRRETFANGNLDREALYKEESYIPRWIYGRESVIKSRWKRDDLTDY